MTKNNAIKDFLVDFLEIQFSKAESDKERLNILSKIKIVSPDEYELLEIKRQMLDVFTKYCKVENIGIAIDILYENIILGDISEIK